LSAAALGSFCDSGLSFFAAMRNVKRNPAPDAKAYSACADLVRLINQVLATEIFARVASGASKIEPLGRRWNRLAKRGRGTSKLRRKS
jgi:hypothetical protein